MCQLAGNRKSRDVPPHDDTEDDDGWATEPADDVDTEPEDDVDRIEDERERRGAKTVG